MNEPEVQLLRPIQETDDPVVVFLSFSVDEVRDGQYNGDLPDYNNG